MPSAKGARNAAIWGSQQLLDNQPKVLGELQTGFNQASGSLNEARDLYKGMSDQGLGGLTRYQALASGGPETLNALQATPGYQFSFDQGLQALNRRRAAGGMLNSGNADADAIQFGQGLAMQTLNQERQAQLPLMDMYSRGIAGQSGALGNLASLATDYYGNRASVLDDTTKNIVGLGTAAFKAGDAAKAQNQQMLMGGINAGLQLLGNFAGGGGGGFTNLFSGMGGGGAGLGSAMKTGAGLY